MRDRTDRRPARGTLISLAIVASALASSGPAVAGGGATQPNVLIVLTDDQRLSGTMAVLPHVERWFGKGGRTFDRGYVPTPLCCPSRATILTGRYAHNHGVKENGANGRRALDHSTTIERYLRDAGYRTAIFGKFFNFWRVRDDPPYFDRWGIVTPSRTSNGYRGGTWNLQGDLRTVNRYSTTFLAARAERFIRSGENDDARPWFMEIATYAPHSVAIPDRAYRHARVGAFRPNPAMTESDRRDKPPTVRAEDASLEAMELTRERQLRTLMSVDDLVADVASTLRRTDESRDTLAFFLSDNGVSWGEHGARAKSYPYDPGVRIPFFMRWPGRVRGSTSEGHLTSTVDVAPTILDAAGIEQDPAVPMDGRSLLGGPQTRRHALLEFWPWVGSSAPEWAAVVSKRYEYTEYYARDGSIVFREFYALRRDRWQLTNVLHDGDRRNDPDVRRLHARLQEDRVCVGSGCP